jgi:hypothetical protein
VRVRARCFSPTSSPRNRAKTALSERWKKRLDASRKWRCRPAARAGSLLIIDTDVPNSHRPRFRLAPARGSRQKPGAVLGLSGCSSLSAAIEC